TSEQVTVVVSKGDIPAGTSMDTLIAHGDFTTESVPAKTEVAGAVTALEQLKGRVSSVPILAGEQIPAARLQGSTDLPGGALGIPKGDEAVTLQLDAQRAGNGTIARGDHVTVFGTFRGVGSTGTAAEQDVTLALVPDVKV